MSQYLYTIYLLNPINSLRKKKEGREEGLVDIELRVGEGHGKGLGGRKDSWDTWKWKEGWEAGWEGCEEGRLGRQGEMLGKQGVVLGGQEEGWEAG
jgi:hypothetical protein